MNISMSVHGLDALRRGLQVAPAMVQRELLATTTALTVAVAGEVQDAMPAVSGLTRASVVWDAFSTPTGALGVVGSPQVAAVVLEDGRAPGKGVSKLGQQAIAQWAKDKLGVQEKEALGVAYLIARKIKREGIEAKRPFAKTLEDNQVQIERAYEDCANRIAAQLMGGAV